MASGTHHARVIMAKFRVTVSSVKSEGDKARRKDEPSHGIIGPNPLRSELQIRLITSDVEACHDPPAQERGVASYTQLSGRTGLPATIRVRRDDLSGRLDATVEH